MLQVAVFFGENFESDFGKIGYSHQMKLPVWQGLRFAQSFLFGRRFSNFACFEPKLRNAHETSVKYSRISKHCTLPI